MHDKTIKLLETSDHYLDKWPWEGNFEEPLSDRNIRAFQKQIDRICGLATGGKPNVRLIWPASKDESISMKFVDGEKTARYGIYSQEYECQCLTPGGLIKIEVVTVDITPPRWMIEDYDEATDKYVHLRTLGYHDERCCGGTESIMGEVCFGLYREPERCDLDDLQRRIQEREAFGERVYADQPLTYAEMQAGLQKIRNWNQIADQMVRNRYKQAIISGLTPQAPRIFSQDPTVQKWGKHHFLSGHNKSGTKESNQCNQET